jgi:hypothetical protein
VLVLLFGNITPRGQQIDRHQSQENIMSLRCGGNKA